MACCCLKYFWLTRTTHSTKIRLTGKISSTMPVMAGLMESIITSTPTMVVTLVISWVTHWFSDWPMVSTSLVMRESTSPTVRFSK